MHALQKLLLFHVLTCLGRIALGIIDGEDAAESIRYMASLQDARGRHVCGGFLISEDFVVTAAHCKDRNPKGVVLGTHDLKKVDETTMRYSVSMMCTPSYSKPERGNDIMLLKLSKKAHMNHRVQPIQRSKAANDMRDCQVAGWGYTKTGGEVVDVLQVAHVPYVNLKNCERMWIQRKVHLPHTVICAGGTSTKGFCKGDSGGPLVCNGMAVGVASFNWSDNCDYPNVPNVYTNISMYGRWISGILEGKKC